ncbi:hypothetical protein LCGC14_1949370 [marine sediment metagenome]|uniref:Uncharacterized protein n=1 Tax=marine sediment metagenome TaxID=412755 RepID=A0A0F9FI87_9ZZZZ
MTKPTESQLVYFNTPTFLHDTEWYDTPITCYDCGAELSQLKAYHKRSGEQGVCTPECHNCHETRVASILGNIPKWTRPNRDCRDCADYRPWGCHHDTLGLVSCCGRGHDCDSKRYCRGCAPTIVKGDNPKCEHFKEKGLD